MFDNRLIAELKKVVGWRDHFDTSQIPALPSSLTGTESGQYYQDFHPNVRLDYIQALLPSNYALNTFLDDIETSAIKQMLNMVLVQKQLNHASNELASNNLIYDSVVKDKPIINESRFVGVQFSMDSDKIGLKAVINRFGLYMSAVENFNVYLYNSMQSQPVATFNFTSTQTDRFTWQTVDKIIMEYDTDQSTSGGVWYLGYYQDDLSGQAIQYDQLNWLNGYCRSCDGGLRSGKYYSISKHIDMRPFYVESASLDPGRELFDHDAMRYTPTNNYGFNFNISVYCDLTQFFIDNRLTMTNVIGQMVALKVLQMMKASAQINNIDQTVQINIIRDIEGDASTQNVPLWKQVENGIKGMNLDQSSINKLCVPCAKKGVSYKAI